MGQAAVTEEEEEEGGESCIFCRETIDSGELYLMAYVNLTDLVARRVLGQEGQPDLFFRSCGHRMHRKCFSQYEVESEGAFECFLCKQSTNIVLPQLSTMQGIDPAQMNTLAEEFLTRIEMVVLQSNADSLHITEQFLGHFSANMAAGVEWSMSRECAFNGIQNSDFFPKNLCVYR